VYNISFSNYLFKRFANKTFSPYAFPVPMRLCRSDLLLSGLAAATAAAGELRSWRLLGRHVLTPSCFAGC